MTAPRPVRDDHLLTIQEAAEWLRVSRWSVYVLINSKQLRTVKIGHRSRIPGRACELGRGGRI